MNLGQTATDTGTLTTDEKSYIQQFKDKAAKFWQQYNDLDAKRQIVANASPDIQKQYADLMDRGSTIRSTIEYVTGAIDKAANAYQSVKDWITSTFGLSGIEGQNYATQLGIIPLIPIAIIAASLAVIGKWVLDAYTLNAKLDKLQQLQDQGVPPDQASSIVAKLEPGGIMQGVGQALPFVLLIVGGVYLATRKKRGS